MKVFYKKDTHVILLFGSTELKQALGVLKALAQHFKVKFLHDAAGDLERDLAQPRLGYVMHTKICEECGTEIDLNGENKNHQKDEDDDRWVHKTCPTLKPHRP